MGLAELDVLEAMDYVQAHFNIDPDRIHLYGYSMGGYGGFSVATRNADRFASFRPIAGSGNTNCRVNNKAFRRVGRIIRITLQ